VQLVSQVSGPSFDFEFWSVFVMRMIFRFRSKLLILCDMPDIVQFIKEADFNFFQNIVHILMPDVLRPIPSMLSFLHNLNLSS